MLFKYVIIFTVLAVVFFPITAHASKHEDLGLLWFVNRENSLPADCHSGDLVKHQGVQLRSPARDAFV